ncbi:SRPBCC domain-containing protein [Streptomyces sp. NBC_01306]|uniref:SRPBCC domain-containing protein n=1 Tax=Streptomyces sp. NBC_01306 TaxID=2903819 RepID=UPI002259F589|nr:SRPBCC domain-containing protein [Streptomyces sp. NBC_01306]MCX4724974.1 carbon monoxide dehydrogenase [Streptomyces sp. NBC_01306]
MEHEVFVPVPAESVRRVLADPARVARCVPGLQQDADRTDSGDSREGALAGRLKVRIDGHTITYRGTVRIAERDGGYEVDGEGTEARGPGSVKLSLRLSLAAEAGEGADADSGGRTGTTLRCTGTVQATDGRLAHLAPDAVLTAARRLLDRFGDRVRAEAQAQTGTQPGPQGADQGPDADADAVPDTAPAPDERPSATGDSGDEAGASVFDAEVPPPSLDPVSEAGFTPAGDPPVEAAHARRTMIGRSAEEVDHAPPRGRYAPVPAPSSSTAGATLRWAAPAAALALASAVVVGRALRRRR